MNILPGEVLFVWGGSLIDDAIEGVTHGLPIVLSFLIPRPWLKRRPDEK